MSSLLCKVLTSSIPLLLIFASRSKNSESLGRLLTKVDSSPVPLLSSFILENKDEDLKVIDVSPIKSLFYNMNLDNDGTEYDPPLPRRRSKNSEFLDLDAKIGKSGIEEIKTLDIN